MSLFDKIKRLEVWDILFELNEQLKTTDVSQIEEDRSKARLPEEFVVEKAEEIAQKEGWSHLVPSKPILWKNEKGNLIWDVTFLLKDRTVFYFGTRASLSIDDKTGEVIGKSYIPH
jgi:hypothetical protein